MRAHKSSQEREQKRNLEMERLEVEHAKIALENRRLLLKAEEEKIHLDPPKGVTWTKN